MADDKAMIVKLAFVYFQTGEWYRAIDEYKKLLTYDPNDAHAYNCIGDAYAKKNDNTDALQNYLKAMELFEQQGNRSKVLSIERKVTKLNPERMDYQQKRIHLTIAKTQEADRLASEGNMDEAVAHYKEIISAEPMNIPYREKFAALFLDHAMVVEAVTQLKAIADIHLEDGHLEAAKVCASKILSLDPNGIDSLRLSAALAEKHGDTQEAVNYHAKLAQMAFEAGHYEEAKKSAEKAMQGGKVHLRPLLAKILVALKQSQEAKHHLELLLQESPGDENLLEQLLTLSEDIKDWPAAHNYITALLQIHPNEPKLLPRLGRVLLQVGKRAEAFQIYMTLATEALKENKVDTAIGYFDSVLVLEPDNLDILKKKAELYLKLGKKHETIEAYKKLQFFLQQKKMAEEARKIGLIVTKLTSLKV
jgi:tetratricopeptide (TPR) repeat protein